MSAVGRLLPLLLMALTAWAQLYVSAAPSQVYQGSLVQVYVWVALQGRGHLYINSSLPILSWGLAAGTAQVPLNATAGGRELSADVALPTTVVATLQVPLGASPGLYPVEVAVDGPGGRLRAATRVEVLSLDPAALVAARPSAYVAGQPVQLPVAVFNPTADLAEAEVSVEGDVVRPYLNSTPSCRAVVPPRGNATCVLQFAVSGRAAPGVYEVALRLRLSSMSGLAGSLEVSRPVQLAVVSRVDFNAALAPQQPVAVGVPAPFLLSLSAATPVPLSNVTVKVEDGDGIAVHGQRTFVLPTLAQAQLPIQATVERYGEVRLPVEVCAFSGACARKEVSLYLPAPRLAASVSFNPPVAYPGAVVTAVVALVSTAPVVDAVIRVDTPLRVLGNSTFAVTLPQGQPVTLYVPLQVPEDASEGSYPVRISVAGDHFAFSLPVSAPSLAVQNVVVVPARVLEGMPAAQVQVQLANPGPVTARDVTVRLLNSTVGPSVLRVDALPPGGPVTLTFYLDTSALRPGNYSVAVEASWRGGAARAVGSLQVRPRASLAVDYRVASAAPGSTAVLTVNVTNLGPVEVRNLRLTLAPSQVFEPHLSDVSQAATASVRLLGDLRPGESAAATFLLDVSDRVPQGAYPLTLVLTWNQTDVAAPGVRYVTLEVPVRGGVDLLVVVPAALAVAVLAAGVALALRRRKAGR